MDLTVNLGPVAVRSCPVFGVLVYLWPGEWVPFAQVDDEGQAFVRKACLDSPLSRAMPERMRDVIFASGVEQRR